MKTLYNITAIVLFLFICLINSTAQTNSGSITMGRSDWEYDWDCDCGDSIKTYILAVLPNTPIKINLSTYTNHYISIYTLDNQNYRNYYSNDYPTEGAQSMTIISSTGKIYIYASKYYFYEQENDLVFTLNYNVDPTYSISTSPSIIQNDQYIGGKLGVGVNPIEKFEVNGNVRINNKLSIGVPYTANYSLFVSNQYNSSVNTSIYNTISKNTTSAVYGLYSSTINNSGNVYGLYSAVGGSTGKLWAGYFNGGDVSVMNGNLSAGVEKPLGILHVRGTRDNAWIYFASNAGFTKPNPQIAYGMAFTWNLSGSEEESIINYSGSNNTRLDFTSWNGTSLKTEMTLRQGNLGIGTKSPTSKLHIATVNGEGIRIGKIGDAGNINVPINALSSQYNIDFTGFRDIANDQIGARISALRFNCYQANNAYVQKTGLAFYTNPKGENTGTTDLIERMRIAPDGKIGIGTDAPDHLLTVKGTIHAREVLVDLNGPLADYVFEPDYTLMPLREVESFVKANKHLPEIPSAAEVKENGLNMGEMQNKLLQKIEELTLYVIEQQKRIEELESKLK